MKTTLDLPASLLNQVKSRACRDGKKFDDAVAELLRKGLAATAPEIHAEPAVVMRDKKTGLPVIKCKHSASPDEEITPERMAAILLAQEAGWHAAG